MRKYTIFAYFEMLDMEDKLYQNKFAVKAAVGLISTLNKVVKHKEEEEKRAAEEKAQWVETEDYAKL